jgi:hypothetical protein
MIWDRKWNCKKAYNKAFIEIKKRKCDMTICRHYKKAIGQFNMFFKGYTTI